MPCEAPPCECDPVEKAEQGCSDPAAMACDAFLLDGVVQTRCMKRSTSAQEGAACQLRLDGQLKTGNCSKGLYCQDLAATATCVNYCRTRRQCPANHLCIDLLQSPRANLDPAASPELGICMPACTFFSSNACSAGTTCRPYLRLPSSEGRGGVCTTIGTVQAGENCVLSTDCGEGLTCEQGVCRLICNGTTTCPLARGCQRYPSPNPEGIGYCP